MPFPPRFFIDLSASLGSNMFTVVSPSPLPHTHTHTLEPGSNIGLSQFRVYQQSSPALSSGETAAPGFHLHWLNNGYHIKERELLPLIVVKTLKHLTPPTTEPLPSVVPFAQNTILHPTNFAQLSPVHASEHPVPFQSPLTSVHHCMCTYVTLVNAAHPCQSVSSLLT